MNDIYIRIPLNQHKMRTRRELKYSVKYKLKTHYRQCRGHYIEMFYELVLQDLRKLNTANKSSEGYHNLNKVSFTLH